MEANLYHLGDFTAQGSKGTRLQRLNPAPADLQLRAASFIPGCQRRAHTKASSYPCAQQSRMSASEEMS